MNDETVLVVLKLTSKAIGVNLSTIEEAYSDSGFTPRGIVTIDQFVTLLKQLEAYIPKTSLPSVRICTRNGEDEDEANFCLVVEYTRGANELERHTGELIKNREDNKIRSHELQELARLKAKYPDMYGQDHPL